MGTAVLQDIQDLVESLEGRVALEHQVTAGSVDSQVIQGFVDSRGTPDSVQRVLVNQGIPDSAVRVAIAGIADYRATLATAGYQATVDIARQVQGRADIRGSVDYQAIPDSVVSLATRASVDYLVIVGSQRLVLDHPVTLVSVVFQGIPVSVETQGTQVFVD